MIRIETESGSIYLIDDDNKIWSRLRAGTAAVIRSDKGEFYWRSSLIIGESLVLFCPPFNKELFNAPREITSTPIVDWKEVNEESTSNS